jgi:hypothetical protein
MRDVVGWANRSSEKGSFVGLESALGRDDNGGQAAEGKITTQTDIQIFSYFELLKF